MKEPPDFKEVEKAAIRIAQQFGLHHEEVIHTLKILGQSFSKIDLTKIQGLPIKQVEAREHGLKHLRNKQMKRSRK